MRKKIVAGNWKMNKTMEDGIKLVTDIIALLSEDTSFTTKDYLHAIIAPPYILLNDTCVLVTSIPKISAAAQNCYAEDKGAFTGEISATMVRSTGAEYVIIGHSERRSYFKEDDQLLAKKVNLALKNNLSPIFCCGETSDERNQNNHFNVVKTQLTNGLFNLNENEIKRVVFAYEPVWAIGTGVTATPQQAHEMHKYIRSLIIDKYGKEIAEEISILYGGSCNAKNAAELFDNPDVDGGLIGGASLIAEEFVKIIDAVK